MHASTYPNGAAQAASIGSPYSKHLTANIRASGLARLAAGIVISDGDVLWRLLLDLQKEVSVGNVEIVGRVERRRKWTPEEKAGQFPLVGAGARRSRLLGPHEAQDLALMPARDGAAGRVVLVVEDGLGRDALPGRHEDAREAPIDQHLVMVGDLAIVGDAAVGDIAALDRGPGSRAPGAGQLFEPRRKLRIRVGRRRGDCSEGEA